MEIKIKDFIHPGKIVSFVNFTGNFCKLKNNAKISYILNTPFQQNISVQKYLEKKLVSFSHERFCDACKMVLLDEKILHANLSKLSFTESKQIRFVEALLLNSETLVFINYEQGFHGKNRSYYQKLFLKLTKYGKCVLLVTNDISFLMGMVPSFILFHSNQYEEILDYYDNKIYKYVSMPEIIQTVKYFESRGVKMEHYLEMKEVLKAIYRSVSSKDCI